MMKICDIKLLHMQKSVYFFFFCAPYYQKMKTSFFYSRAKKWLYQSFFEFEVCYSRLVFKLFCVDLIVELFCLSFVLCRREGITHEFSGCAKEHATPNRHQYKHHENGGIIWPSAHRSAKGESPTIVGLWEIFRSLY